MVDGGGEGGSLGKMQTSTRIFENCANNKCLVYGCYLPFHLAIVESWQPLSVQNRPSDLDISLKPLW